jgi:hypothetical protein
MLIGLKARCYEQDMILRSNLARVVKTALSSTTVLDVGGWFQPLNAATHVLDIGPYETRQKHAPLDPENAERFSAKTWVKHDACCAPWPFPDKFFEFSFSSHLLEDVRDPLTVCAELQRVAKSGYIETPSRMREIFVKGRFFRLKTLFGHMPEIGFPHHRWFVELDGDHLTFTAKDLRLLKSYNFFIRRGDLGRKLTEQESGIGLFWHDRFTCEEAPIFDDAQLIAYRDAALKAARGVRDSVRAHRRSRVAHIGGSAP